MLIQLVQSMYRFLEDLDEGVFIQQTLDSVLMNEDGKQLMVGGRVELTVENCVLLSFYDESLNVVMWLYHSVRVCISMG